MRAARAIAGVELRRFLADRSNVFFAFVFPLLLVLVIGSQFGEGGSRGSVVLAGPDGAVLTEVADALADAGLTVRRAGAADVREAVARGRADVGLVLDADDARAVAGGRPAALTLLPGTQASARSAAVTARTALRSLALEAGAVATVADAAGVDPDRARAALDDAATRVERPELEVVDVAEVAQELSGVGQFELGAAGQLLLFTFLSSLAGSETLIRARRDRVVARALTAPVTPRHVVSGQALGRLAIAGFQGAYIMAATALLFRVDWGDLVASLTVLVLFALVAAGGAMLLGALLDNDAAAGGLGVGVGLVLAALGGSMFPLELFPDSLRTVAHVTPHAWAYEAFAQIQRHDGGLLDVLPQLGVLAGYAVVLLALGSWALRRSLERAV